MVGPAQPASITVAPMGVDMELFTRQTSYQPPQSRDELRLFSCGRLHPGKGHDDLIRAVAWLHREGVDVKLTIAGADVDGDGYRTRLERLIGQLGLSLRVHLAGALSEQAVVDQLERAHLFVLASHHEALGVATMEAMAMEVPVVVTRTGGVPELVEDGCEGVLVAPRHPIELARAVRGLAASPLDCRRMGRAGRRKIEAGFHSGISARAILDGIVSSQSRRPMDRRIRASEAATP
jgi:glycosyltransferase involved in cell wall biosynthesis